MWVEVAHALFDAGLVAVFLAVCTCFLWFNWWVISRSSLGWVEQRLVGFCSMAALLMVFSILVTLVSIPWGSWVPC